jgi:DNA-directed RNA polymerase subunit RPC12/RpoP
MSYICGFCGDKVGSASGYHHSGVGATIYICTNCGGPTFFLGDDQYPGPLLGRNIDKLPDDISEIYREIRDSIQNGNFTAAQLLGRKLIMHLAVDVAGAKEGDTFVSYVSFLKQAGYIPPTGDKWIDYVKKMGNEKNHEIKIGKKEEAEKILKFIEVLLIFIYEFAGEVDEEKLE